VAHGVNEEARAKAEGTDDCPSDEEGERVGQERDGGCDGEHSGASGAVVVLARRSAQGDVRALKTDGNRPSGARTFA